MSKPPSTVQTTSNSTQTVPQYVSDAQQGLLGYGQSILAPFASSQPNYSVAGLNTDQTTAYDLTRQLAQGAFENTAAMPSWYGSNPQAAMSAPANTYTASSYAAPSAGSAASYDPRIAGDAAVYGATQAGPAATYDPRIAGDAATYGAAQAGTAQSYGASTGQAAQLGGSDYTKFMNPYIQGVIDPAVANLRRQSDINAAQIGAQSAGAGSFGGSREALRQAQNTRATGEQVSQMVSQLMSAGFDKATANAAQNAQLQQQMALANQSALNQAAQVNAGAQNQFNLSDVAARNAAGQYNAGATNQMAQYNSGAINQAARDNMNAANQMAQYNSGVVNAAARDNANNTNQMAQFNAGAINTAARDNTNAANQMAQYNTGLLNQAGQFGASAQNTAGQTNAAAQNARDQFLASLGLQSRAQDITATQLQNSLLNDAQTRRMAAIQAILANGGSQQAQLQKILNVAPDALAKLQAVTPGTVPVNTNTVGTAPNTQKSLIEQLMGAGVTLGAAALAPCDIRLKKNIAPYGVSDRGRPLFAFQYAWEPDDAPLTVGPMAQIEEAHDPDSVVELLGIKLVKVA